MEEHFFLVPVNNGHSKLVELKLPYVRFKQLNISDWHDLFGVLDFSGSSKALQFCLCQDKGNPQDINDWWYLVIIHDNKSVDFKENSNVASSVENINKAINNIEELILKIQLFSGSDVNVDEVYFFNRVNGKQYCSGGGPIGPQLRYGPVRRLILDDENIIELQEFIDNFNISKCSSRLQEAIKIFSRIFKIPDLGIRIVLLMTVLEMLFGFDTNQELSYRISRNTAVFLSDTPESFKVNFRIIKDYYDCRSKYVHSGNTKNITFEKVAELQKIINKILLKYIKVEKNIMISQDLLNEAGYDSPLFNL